MNATVYMRYSHAGQSETSIDGQRAAIEAFAQKNGYNIIREYIDRARSATTDDRPQFHKLVNDSAKHQFEAVLVYQFDRFARNRYDSATYKTRLKKNGVKVISVTENITDDPSGILIESVLEGYAEFFSADLSQKVRRGVKIAVENCQYLGGAIPLGYTVDENKRFQIDPVTAPIVVKIFELYAASTTLKGIHKSIVEQFGIKQFGNKYVVLNKLLENRSYIGYYTRCGANFKGGMPQIISEELFERVQMMRKKDKKTPAKARAHEEYLLTTKLFCGYHSHDPEHRVMMVGVSGTSKSDKIFHYYTCKHVWNKKGCKKKNVRKDYIESMILDKAREQLTDENISRIAETVSEISKRENNSLILVELKKRLKENASAIDNLLKAIENGEHIELLSERITQKKLEKAELEKTLAREQIEKTEVDENEIKFFLNRIKSGDVNDIKYKRALIAVFINAVFLYDDRMTVFFNAVDNPIEADFSVIPEEEKPPDSNDSECSYMIQSGVPRKPSIHAGLLDQARMNSCQSKLFNIRDLLA